jgi:ribonuclease HII
MMARRLDPAEIPPSPTLDFEFALWQRGFLAVAGLDEAGRGAWAGPVSAGAVILPPDRVLLDSLEGVRDSKQLSPRARENQARRIRAEALAWGVGFASHIEIDELGILPATRLAMRRALAACVLPAVHLLVDALRLPEELLPQTALIKGDARSLSIAAASILAKTTRDEHMRELDNLYPGYDFARHKGYGTRIHQAALESLGPCPIHRCSFAPVRSVLSASGITSPLE